MALGCIPPLSDEELASTFSRLVGSLAGHGFGATWSLPADGSPWHAVRELENLRRFASGRPNVYESSAVAGWYRRAFAKKHPSAQRLHDIFHRGRPAPRVELERLLGAHGDEHLARDLIERQVLVAPASAGRQYQSRLRATAYGPNIVLSDTPHIFEFEQSTFVFCGRCSSRLAEVVGDDLAAMRASSAQHRGAGPTRSLDLCTGSGIQAFHVAREFDAATGSDLNPRAIRFARANAVAYQIANTTFLESDLFARIEGTFDLITANTPFVLLDEGSKAIDGYGGKYGMEVELRLMSELDRFLSPGGTAHIVASSAFVGGRDRLEDSLREMFSGKPYEIELVPVTEYYSRHHYATYTKLAVDKCVLYLVRFRKDASPTLRLTVRPLSLVKQAGYWLKLSVDRDAARRDFARRPR